MKKSKYCNSNGSNIRQNRQGYDEDRKIREIEGITENKEAEAKSFKNLDR